MDDVTSTRPSALWLVATAFLYPGDEGIMIVCNVTGCLFKICTLSSSIGTAMQVVYLTKTF